jgi:putative ABC transport system permease protein
VKLGPNQAEIVGVVGDIRRAALSDQPRADMYLSFEQASGPQIGLFVRTAGNPLDALPVLRTTLRALEPNTVLYGARTLDDIAAESAAIARLAMQLLSAFAVVALALAATGIYGVISYSVRRRTREIGTRLALGASHRDIVALVMRQAAAVTGLGLALGLGVGLAAARSLGAILYGVPPWDPVSLMSAIMILTIAALTASYLPARRAARIDPARTLAVE